MGTSKNESVSYECKTIYLVKRKQRFEYLQYNLKLRFKDIYVGEYGTVEYFLTK